MSKNPTKVCCLHSIDVWMAVKSLWFYGPSGNHTAWETKFRISPPNFQSSQTNFLELFFRVLILNDFWMWFSSRKWTSEVKNNFSFQKLSMRQFLIFFLMHFCAVLQFKKGYVSSDSTLELALIKVLYAFMHLKFNFSLSFIPISKVCIIQQH
jgi:hypothetical protein